MYTLASVCEEHSIHEPLTAAKAMFHIRVTFIVRAVGRWQRWVGTEECLDLRTPQAWSSLEFGVQGLWGSEFSAQGSALRGHHQEPGCIRICP